jgi:hypothetical protein
MHASQVADFAAENVTIIYLSRLHCVELRFVLSLEFCSGLPEVPAGFRFGIINLSHFYRLSHRRIRNAQSSLLRAKVIFMQRIMMNTE